jgi:hypothetical protein
MDLTSVPICDALTDVYPTWRRTPLANRLHERGGFGRRIDFQVASKSPRKRLVRIDG